MEKILSVSVAAYNMESYLPYCLDSFLEESVLRRCEVIIVDDGSKDKTAEIAQSYVNQYPETYHLISKQNGGLGSAFNVALRESCGTYFKWLDADDMFDIDGLKSLLDILESTEADIVVTPYIRFEDKTGFLYKTEDTYKNIEKNVVMKIQDSISDWKICGMHSMTCRKEKIKQIELLEHCFYVDMTYAIKAICLSDTILFLEKPVYLYRLAREGQSVETEGFKKHYLEHWQVVTSLLEYYRTSEQAKKIQKVTWTSLAHSQSRIFYKLPPSKKYFKEYLKWIHYIKKYYPELSYVMEGKKGYLLQKENYIFYYIVVKYMQHYYRHNDLIEYTGETIQELIGRRINR
jgi:glycosyltransferase involved in cell wall biosynthesis